MQKYKKFSVGAVLITFIIIGVIFTLEKRDQMIDDYNVKQAIIIKENIFNLNKENTFTNLDEFNKQYNQDIGFKKVCPYVHNFNTGPGFLLGFKLYSEKYNYRDRGYYAIVFGVGEEIDNLCHLYGGCRLMWEDVNRIVGTGSILQQEFLDTIFSESCE